MNNPMAKKYWDKTTVDIGKISKKDRKEITYIYTGPWTITRAKPGCGSCTQVTWTDKTVSATFAPATLSTGKKEKTITVTLQTPTGEVMDELKFYAEVF